jgi:hypothetical protein
VRISGYLNFVLGHSEVNGGSSRMDPLSSLLLEKVKKHQLCDLNLIEEAPT